MRTMFSHPQLNRTLESCAMTECQQDSRVPGHYECRFVGVKSGSLALEKVDGDVICVQEQQALAEDVDSGDTQYHLQVSLEERV